MATAPSSTENLLLNALAVADRNALMAQMERIEIQREMTLAPRRQPVPALYFLEHGIASVVAIDGTSRTEVGIIGSEGVTGTSALLGSSISALETMVQVDGGTALRIGVAEMRAAMEHSEGVRRTMLAFVQCFLLQVSYAVVACAEHMMEARLARWLLMCHDRVVGDHIALTHEFMAVMISAQRSGVTVALHSLEGTGMIRSTRGLVTILDRAKLEDLAGYSYGTPEAEYRKLIGPFGK